MPSIKINGLLVDDNFKDAIIEWEENSTIEISDENECLIARFQPDDFLAVADAIAAYYKRINDAKKEV